VQAYAAQLEQFPFGPSLVKQIATEAAVATATLTRAEHDIASLTIERDALATLVERKQRQIRSPSRT
jgi:hypothetical protein